ncbi:hypothetical protein ACH3XW_43975 [Acanthocheilonema viteae]|uniref:Uncharacterized protein n=1 Tax=Acanthocheilonema viteae TaxID=6277 RepID=A0A498SM62_ACAVI|nr:unnamed protein product [Acanthocheilonema viteae]
MFFNDEIIAQGPPTALCMCGDTSFLADCSLNHPPIPICYSTPIEDDSTSILELHTAISRDFFDDLDSILTSLENFLENAENEMVQNIDNDLVEINEIDNVTPEKRETDENLENRVQSINTEMILELKAPLNLPEPKQEQNIDNDLVEINEIDNITREKKETDENLENRMQSSNTEKVLGLNAPLNSPKPKYHYWLRERKPKKLDESGDIEIKVARPKKVVKRRARKKKNNENASNSKPRKQRRIRKTKKQLENNITDGNNDNKNKCTDNIITLDDTITLD